MTRPSSAGRHENSGPRAVGDEFDGEDGTRPLGENEWARWRDVLTVSSVTSSESEGDVDKSDVEEMAEITDVTADAEVSADRVIASDSEDVVIDVREQVTVAAGAVTSAASEVTESRQSSGGDTVNVSLAKPETTMTDVTVTEIDVTDTDVADTDMAGAVPVDAEDDGSLDAATVEIADLEAISEWIADATTDPGTGTDTTAGWEDTDTDTGTTTADTTTGTTAGTENAETHSAVTEGDVLVATDGNTDASGDHAEVLIAVDSSSESQMVPLTELAPTVSVVRQRREQLLRQQAGNDAVAEDTLDVAADTTPVKHDATILEWHAGHAPDAADDKQASAEPEATLTLPAATDDLDDGVDDERAEPVDDVVARERSQMAHPETSAPEDLPNAVADVETGSVGDDPVGDAAPDSDADASDTGPLAPVIDEGPAAVRPGQKQWPGMAYRPSPRLWAGYRRPNLRGGPFSRTTRPVDDVVPVGDVEPVREKPADRPEWADRPRYIPIGAMVPSDVNACGQMRGEFGWKPTLAQLYWANDIADGYVATVDDEIGGVFFVHPYGATATISNVLVRKRFHYCGLGTRMMKFLLTKYPDVEFRLDATDAAKPLFRNFGFYEAGQRVTFRGLPEQLRGGALPFGVRPLLPLDWPHVMRLDAGGYGEGRADFLRSAADHADEVAVGVAGFGDIRCFGVRWHDGQDHVIGPVAATSFDAARAMIGHLAEGCTGTVQLTVGQEHSRLIEWLHGCGFEVTERLTHMVRPVEDPVALPDTETCYVTGSSAFG